MSNDHAKKVIVEKLLSDAGLRDRVADFILYRGFLSNVGALKSISREEQTQLHNGDKNKKDDGFYSHIPRQTGKEGLFEVTLQGYEYWEG